MGGIREDAHLVDYRKGADMVPSRDGYGHGLLWLCEHDDRVVVCDADLAKSTRTIWVRDKFPEKFVDFGIAEQDMLAEAGGMSRTGLVPFVTTYGVFVAGRAEGLKTRFAIAKPIKIKSSTITIRPVTIFFRFFSGSEKSSFSSITIVP